MFFSVRCSCDGMWWAVVLCCVWCFVLWCVCCVVWCGVVWWWSVCGDEVFVVCLCKKRRSVVLLHFCSAWVCVSCVGVASVNARMCVGVGLWVCVKAESTLCGVKTVLSLNFLRYWSFGIVRLSQSVIHNVVNGAFWLVTRNLAVVFAHRNCACDVLACTLGIGSLEYLVFKGLWMVIRAWDWSGFE